jgi:hypothetical protein
LLDERVSRDEAELARERVKRADAARARYRADADDCREVASRYDGAFASFGVETPQAKDGEDPDDYRLRLFRRLLRRLPDDHDLQGIDPSGLPEIALDNFEAQLIRDAAAEGASPSEANLPADGSLISRNRVDDATNARSITWHGRRSFIADLTRPGRRVTRIVHPAHGAIWGAPFSRA